MTSAAFTFWHPLLSSPGAFPVTRHRGTPGSNAPTSRSSEKAGRVVRLVARTLEAPELRHDILVPQRRHLILSKGPERAEGPASKDATALAVSAAKS